ncbi:MAG: class D sortase [Oscillospiraceae bacterium]
MEKKYVKRVILSIVTPMIMLILCGAILVLCGIKPYNVMSKYISLAFMDDMKVTSTEQGLVIKDNDISMGYSGETSPTGEVTYPNFGEQYAVLNCPTVDISVPVYWGSNSTLLEKGACQPTTSAVIGTDGNTVIDAHVNTFFANLDNLQVGDIVTLNTNYGEFTYQVREKIEFNKDNNSYVNPKDENILTLYTCKIQLLGTSNIRVGAICDLIKSKFYVY